MASRGYRAKGTQVGHMEVYCSQEKGVYKGI